MVRARNLLSLLAGAAALALVAWAATRLLQEPPAHALPDVQLDHSRPKPQGGFFRARVEEPATLNPFTGDDGVFRQFVIAFTHDALLDYDPADGQLRPALATRIPEPTAESTAERPRYEFELREGVRFSDGAPLTMADIEFTFAAAQSPDLPLGEVSEALMGVAGLDVIDARRFGVTFERFHFAGMERFATRFRVVQRAWFERAIAECAQTKGLSSTPAPGTAEYTDCLASVRTPGPGTGPFQLHGGPAAWRPAVSLTLSANLHCWRRAAYPTCWNLAGVQLQFDSPARTALVAALNGEIDYLTGMNDYPALLEEHPRLAERYRLEVYRKKRAAALVVVWNCREPPFDAAGVRRAVAMALGRDRILATQFDGQGDVPAAWLPPGSPLVDPTLTAHADDPAGARALLAELGIEKLTVPLTFPSPAFEPIATLMSDSLARAGIELDPVFESWSKAQGRLRTGEFEGGILFVYNHPALSDPGEVLHSRNSGEFGGYTNPVLDELLDRAAASRDPAARTELFHAASRLIKDEEPLTVLLYPAVQVLVHRRLRGVEIGPLGLWPESWWIEPTDQGKD